MIINLPRKHTFFILFGIIFVAAAMRLWGIAYDLPYGFHPDEQYYLNTSQTIFKNGDLNPHFFNYPSLPIYINTAVYIPYYLIGKLTGLFTSPADIQPMQTISLGVNKFPDPTVVLMGRLITILFGIGTVILVYHIGKKVTGETAVGLTSAFITAVAPANVTHSRYITPDTFATFWATAAFLAIIYIARQGKTRHYILAGIAVGFAVSSKYNSGLIILPLILAHFFQYGRQGIKNGRLYAAILFAGLAFAATTPFAILDHATFIEHLAFESQHYSITGHEGMEGDTLNWYLRYMWQTAGIIYLFAGMEILHGIGTRNQHLLLLAAFPATYFAFITQMVVRNERSFLLITPFLYLLVASFIIYLIKKSIFFPEKNRLFFTAVITGILLACLISPAFKTIKMTQRLITPNSRKTAVNWITTNIPPGTNIAIEAYSPYIDPTQYHVTGMLRLIDQSMEWYTAQKIQYLIFGEAMFGRFYAAPNRYSTQISRYEALFQQAKLTAIFNDGGYQVRIYKIGQAK